MFGLESNNEKWAWVITKELKINFILTPAKEVMVMTKTLLFCVSCLGTKVMLLLYGALPGECPISPC